MSYSVLLDTSFFVRLLNAEDPLHKHALGYYRYFLQNQVVLKISTISIAEYCVRGKADELPLRNLQILPFSFEHAQKTGEFAKVIFEENRLSLDKLNPRAIIPNDAKLFAQADKDANIRFFVTSDSRSQNTYSALKRQLDPDFRIMDIAKPYTTTFGLLDFDE